ncbi:MAG: chromate transporter [Firmicutes bacterium]|nr:chromate transporter [Bacillota bacterium]
MAQTIEEVLTTDKQTVATVVEPPSLLAIFWTFFKIGAFTFGGGYAMISLIEQELVQRRGWMGPQDFLDCFASVQLIPGAVAINMGLFTGSKMRGAAGGLAAAAGVTLPSFVIISLIAAVFHNFHQIEMVGSFFQGVRPVIVGLILATALRIARQSLDARWKWVAALIGLVIMFTINIHPIVIVLLAATTGLFLAK